MKIRSQTSTPARAAAGLAAGIVFCQIAGAASLVHRYSFSGDATDSVGGAHGSLLANGTIDSDMLSTSGTPGTTTGVSLPVGAVQGLTGDFSIEIYSSYTGTTGFAALFTFFNGTGASNVGERDTYLLASLRRANKGNPSGVGVNPEGGATADFQDDTIILGPAIATNTPTHFVFTYEAATKTPRLYVNGEASPAVPPLADPLNLEVVGATFRGINGNNPVDPSLNGSTDDFRIYDGTLDAGQVLALKDLGPDADNQAVMAAAGSKGTSGVAGSRPGAGIFKATENDNDLFPSGTTVAAPGVKIDTNGFDLSINTVLAYDESLGGAADGGLSKMGEGTLNLFGANTFTGETVVDGGVLMVNNSAGSGLGKGVVKVGEGATLGGTGAFDGRLKIESGGTLAPGDKVQGLVGGGLSFGDRAIYAVDFDSSAIEGTDADVFVANGDLTLGEAVELKLSDLARMPVEFSVGKVFTLINYTGTWNSIPFTMAGKTLSEGQSFVSGHNTWKINYQSRAGGGNFAGEQKPGSFVNLTAVAPVEQASSGGGKTLVIVGAAGVLLAAGVVFTLKRRKSA